jgi:hypothetical protein
VTSSSMNCRFIMNTGLVQDDYKVFEGEEVQLVGVTGNSTRGWDQDHKDSQIKRIFKEFTGL